MQKPEIKRILIPYKENQLSIEYFIRKGNNKETILFIHGLGGAKENFWTATQFKDLSDYTLICFDNPGTGNSSYSEKNSLNIDDLVEVTRSFIELNEIEKFHLAGASMGGLIAQLYLLRYPSEKVISFINIEGNLMPEDCMFSSKVIRYSYDEFNGTGYQEGIADMRKSINPGYHIIANNLELNTNVKSYYDFSFPTVSYSNNGKLLDSFIELPLRKLFIYGEDNKTLSYLPMLRVSDIKMAEIPLSNHFVFYDNPFQMYKAIMTFIVNDN